MDAAPHKNRPWTNVVGLATVFLIFPLGVAFIIGWVLAMIALHLALLVAWLPRGRRVLFVASADRRWQQQLEQRVAPRLPKNAVLLDGSQQAGWSPFALGVWLYRMWSGPRAEGPIAIVVRAWGAPRVFKLDDAFEALERENSAPIETIERALQSAAA